MRLLMGEVFVYMKFLALQKTFVCSGSWRSLGVRIQGVICRVQGSGFTAHGSRFTV